MTIHLQFKKVTPKNYSPRIHAWCVRVRPTRAVHFIFQSSNQSAFFNHKRMSTNHNLLNAMSRINIKMEIQYFRMVLNSFLDINWWY